MNKGFTLVELLGVITILLIILVLAIPAVNKLISSSEDTIYDAQINRILSATYDYSLKNLSILPDKYQKNYITLSELIYNGYLDPLKDPKTNLLFPDDYLISIENVGSGYRNTEKHAKKSGDYLYKIENNLMDDSDYISNKPQIFLAGLDRNNNSYTTILNQGEAFVDAAVTVLNNVNVDITDNVKLVKNILLNDELVSSVDTTKVGIYKVNYAAIYVDSNSVAYANCITWNIIVNDTEAPVIIVANNTNISVRDKSYNLLQGVRCIDNSGKCDITYTGTINYGTTGTYVIEYVAKDPSGNTATARRTIIVQ